MILICIMRCDWLYTYAWTRHCFLLLMTMLKRRLATDTEVLAFSGRFKNKRPKGPWVAHLRKRSKVTVETIIENPRGMI